MSMLHMILAHWYVVTRQHDDIIIYDIDRNLEGPLVCFVAQLFIAKEDFANFVFYSKIRHLYFDDIIFVQKNKKYKSSRQT